MRWHKEGVRDNDDLIVHPSDGDAWKALDTFDPEFAADPRNVRIGLATDGFTPFGQMASSYSCWPVFVIPYNLPPSLCMKYEFIFLCLIIPGPDYPGKNLNVMLKPLIEELKELWKGVEAYDVFTKQIFKLRVAYLWSVHDFMAYAIFTGWSTHGRLTCPYCGSDTDCFHLWDKNDNNPVQSPRYEMLMQYLSMSKTLKLKDLHSYPEYGAFICGNQIQLDVSKENFISVINVFNQIEAAKAYLFANSEFPDSSWNTKIARDIFWEQSMHGILQENAGVNLKDFKNEDEFFTYLSKSAIFTAKRGGQDYYFYPIPAIDYLGYKKIEAYNLSGETVEITPKQEDFENHRSYQYQDLTTRGTVEFRSVCAQSFDKTFVSAAFHLEMCIRDR